MAGRYSDLTDEQLLAEIAQYRAAIKAATLGVDGDGVGTVIRVIGEGRRMDFTPANVKDARVELRELEAELARRPGYYDRRQWAIAVEI